jgi:6-phosphogluconolactonase
MVKEALLSRILSPVENVHRMGGEIDPARAAADYQAELERLFSPPPGDPPRFDLILLGLGDDGHTASLFPGSTALSETAQWVAPSYVEKLQAHRLTMTLPLINNAAQISFLISGRSKAAVVKEILARSTTDYPAARIKPLNGHLCWFITQDAAAASLSSGVMEGLKK